MRIGSVLLALTAVVPVAAAAPHALTLSPERSKVTFVLEATGHDVEGTLALKSGAVRFDPATGEASGELVVDLVTAQTGNKSRDKTMHREVLEDGSWPLATFRATRFRGTVPAEGDGEVVLDGVLSLHGADHKMTLTGKVHVAKGALAVDADFPIPFVEWGMHDPSWFVLKVAKVVKVHVHAEGDLRVAE
ncbi:MAG TPA: YceI family protein [Candidatus Polarisedimenticolaceae bacterium]